MIQKICFALIFASFFSLAGTVRVYSQGTPQRAVDELKKQVPKVYIDCGFCDIDYIKEHINFINYVRDRKEADAHVLITKQSTGSGGDEFTLTFLGREKFSEINAVLNFFAGQMDTEHMIRTNLVKTLKMGLAPYVAKTPMRDRLILDFKDEVEPTAVEDDWDLWVFNLSTNSFVEGQRSTESISISGNLSANRVTPRSKLRLGLAASYSEDKFDIEDAAVTSTSDSQSFSGLYVKSLNDHWSLGGFLTCASSTYSNIGFAVHPTPAVEYNVFPYADSTRRQLRCLYRIGYSFVKYREETIYDKTKENLLFEGLIVTLELKEPWGTISSSLEGTHYFFDFSKNRLVLSGEVSVNIAKGLSLDVLGSYSRIQDQLSLPKAGASYEEILLMRKELVTDFRYDVSIGLSYTFGSIYSNVVNPRFGNGY